MVAVTGFEFAGALFIVVVETCRDSPLLMEAGWPITQEGILDSSWTRILLGAAAFAETKREPQTRFG